MQVRKGCSFLVRFVLSYSSKLLKNLFGKVCYKPSIWSSCFGALMYFSALVLHRTRWNSLETNSVTKHPHHPFTFQPNVIPWGQLILITQDPRKSSGSRSLLSLSLSLSLFSHASCWLHHEACGDPLQDL
jgi:hypothetical protein